MPSRALAPRKRRSASVATASPRPAGRPTRPAALLHRSRAADRMGALVGVEHAEARREEVMDLVRLADEVEVVDLRGMSGRLKRGETGVRDRSRGKPEPVTSVVGVRALQLGFG